jgi:hypothetical protein
MGYLAASPRASSHFARLSRLKLVSVSSPFFDDAPLRLRPGCRQKSRQEDCRSPHWRLELTGRPRLLLRHGIAENIAAYRCMSIHQRGRAHERQMLDLRYLGSCCHLLLVPFDPVESDPNTVGLIVQSHKP